MKWLNYHHLLYFWTAARTGAVTAAAAELGLAQPTISAQIRTLETQLERKLFRQVGRNLELTEAGRIVYRYADDIFSLGAELLDTLEGRPTGSRPRLRVGVADVLPKTAVTRVLLPAVGGEEPAHLVCLEGKPADLLAKLALNELDLVLSDSPVGAESSIRAYNHMLGESPVALFGAGSAADAAAAEFPQSLDGAPFVLPAESASLRRMLDFWFQSRGIHPRVIAEFEDSALMKAFAPAVGAFFPAPEIAEKDIIRIYDVRKIGTVEEVRERFYAISRERKVKHPAVLALLDSAHRDIFI